jgi:hypothetical protein
VSITQKVSELDEIGTTFGLSAGGQCCFMCGELLVDPAVMWSGSNGQQIYLHVNCVLPLCVGLLRDKVELEDKVVDMNVLAVGLVQRLRADLAQAIRNHPRKPRGES